MILSVNKKIPNWLKLAFKLLLLSILVLKLFGFTTIYNVLYNPFFFKIFTFTSCSLIIIYQLLNLYFLHKFFKKDINISDISVVLPDILKNWLNSIDILSQNELSIKEFKKMCYFEILIYSLIMLFYIIVL